MKKVYKFYVKQEDGEIYQSAGKFVNIESAKNKINQYLSNGEHFLGWKIVNTETGETVEQNGAV